MTQDERILELVEIIHQQGKVTQEFICQRYGISYDSARRDLLKLGQMTGILRVRGGAISQPPKLAGRSYRQRSEPDAIKLRLARYAASLIQPQDVVLLDTGTIPAEIARATAVEACFITNSLDILAECSDNDSIRKIMLGGEFNPFNRAIYSAEAIRQLSRYQADKAFIGVPAFSEHGLCCEQELEAEFKHEMTRQAAYRICVCEYSKFNQRLAFHGAGWDDMDCVITDQPPPTNFIELFTRHDIDLRVVA